MYDKIREQAKAAVLELLEIACLEAGDIFVVGCSSSEVIGEQIGKNSSIEAARAIFDGIYPTLKENGIFLAVQCCEHLNRAIVIERAAIARDHEIVSVIPQQHAGGSFATVAWERFEKPVVVEEIKASAGIDIGGTLIGMHLKKVAVPVRLKISKIGEARIICARTRNKYIGGSRAVYEA